MKRIEIAELRRHLFRNLRDVEHGAEVEITHRGRLIARIVPVGQSSASLIIRPKRPFSSIRRKRYSAARWKVSSTDLLLEERHQR